MASIGYQPPVAYGAGISITARTQTVSYAGQVFGPNLADIPFTTSGTFESTKFRLISGVTAADLAAASGAALVGNGGESVKESLDALQLPDYAALRAYKGPRKSVYVTGVLGSAAPSGIAGMFVLDAADTTSADNGGTVIVAANGKRWKRVHGGVLLPEWFGATGDGIANDTSALNAWATALRTEGRPGRSRNTTYRVTQAAMGVTFTGLRGCVIDFNGAVFKALDGDLVANGQAGFYFTDNIDCEFRNFLYDGNRAARTLAGEAGSHGVYIGASNRHVRFVNCRSINGVVDNWYVRGTSGTLATYPTDVSLIDCEGIGAFRNNISPIGSVRLKIHGGRYNEAAGTAPMAGIDFEPNVADVFGNTGFEVINVETSGNGGDGLSIGGDAVNSGYVHNLKGSLNGDSLLNVSRCAGLVVGKLGIGDHPTVVRGVVDIGSAAADVEIDGISVSGNTATVTGSQCIVYVHSAALRVKVKAIKAKNISIPAYIGHSDNLDLDDVRVEDCTATGSCIGLSPAADKPRLRNIRTYRTAGVGLYVEGPKPEIQDIYCEDSDSTVSAIRVTATATDAVLRGVRVHETTAIPAGAYAIRIDTAPKEIAGLDATGGYTEANVLFGTGTLFASTKIANVSPDCFAKTVPVDPPSLAAGAGYTMTTALGKANVGDACVVHAPYDLQGVIATASVSAAGNVRLSMFNATSGAIDLPSANWVISLKKS